MQLTSVSSCGHPADRAIVDSRSGRLLPCRPARVENIVSDNLSIQVKLNERELTLVRDWLELPAHLEGSCRAGAARFGWRASCVTLGARGCAMLVGHDYVEARGIPVAVADTVGAGDAFAAAFVHGLVRGWSAPRVAEFSNQIGAMVASVPGAIPHR